MSFPVTHGEPLEEIVEGLGGHAPKTSLIFIIDGCRADALYRAIKVSRMPNLKRLMEDVGHVRYDNCFTVFPSVTVTCHASIVTGTNPGHHGIVGNEWFIRKNWRSKPSVDDRDELYKATREYVKRSWLHWRSDPGLANGFFTGGYFDIANSDMYETVRTIYEAYNAIGGEPSSGMRSASIYEMVWRGVDYRDLLDVDDAKALLGGRFDRFIRCLFCRKTKYSFDNKGLDRGAMEGLVELMSRAPGDVPGVIVAWLPGMDGFSHKHGACRQGEYFKHRGWLFNKLVGHLDAEFGGLRTELERHGLLDDVLLCITADHGQSDCGESEEKAISNAEVYRYLEAAPGIPAGERFPVTASGEVDDNCKDATVIVIGNGGACHVYLSGRTDWSDLPDAARIARFAGPLSEFPASDQVFVRSGVGGYMWWDDTTKSFRDLGQIDEAEYPFARERVGSFEATERGGDIIISARYPYYFAGHTMLGEHGSLHREDSHVPLIFIGGGLQVPAVGRNVRVIDIAPTLCSAMSCLGELKREGNKRDKLTAIMDAIQGQLCNRLYRDGPEALLKRIDSAIEAGRLKRAWDVDQHDMRRNFKIKVKRYLEDDKITPADYEALTARYADITGEQIL